MSGNNTMSNKPDVGTSDCTPTDSAVLRVTLEGVNMVHMNWYGGADVFWQAEIPTTTSDGELIWECICRSEPIPKDRNPKWKPAEIAIQLANQFDRHKPLKFSFYDWENNAQHQPMGNFMTSVNQLIAAKADRKLDGTWNLAKAIITKTDKREEFGRIVVVDAEIVAAEKKKDNEKHEEKKQDSLQNMVENLALTTSTIDERSVLALTLQGVDMALTVDGMLGLGGSDIFYCVEAQPTNRHDGIEWEIIHQSETVEDTINPRWGPAILDLRELCKGDLDKPIRISFMDEHEDGGHQPMGQLVATIRDLLMSQASKDDDLTKALPTKSEDGRDYGKVVVIDARIISNEEGRTVANGKRPSIIRLTSV